MAIDNAVETVANNALELVVDNAPNYADMNFLEKIWEGAGDVLAGNIGRGGKAIAEGFVPIVAGVAVGGLIYFSLKYLLATSVAVAKDVQFLALVGKKIQLDGETEEVVAVFDGSSFNDLESIEDRMWLLKGKDGAMRLVNHEALMKGKIEGHEGTLAEIFADAKKLEKLTAEITKDAKKPLTELARDARRASMKSMAQVRALTEEQRLEMDVRAKRLAHENAKLRGVADALSKETVTQKAQLEEAAEKIEILEAQVADLEMIAAAKVTEMLAEGDEVYKATFEELKRVEALLDEYRAREAAGHIDIDEPSDNTKKSA